MVIFIPHCYGTGDELVTMKFIGWSSPRHRPNKKKPELTKNLYKKYLTYDEYLELVSIEYAYEDLLGDMHYCSDKWHRSRLTRCRNLMKAIKRYLNRKG